MFAIVSRKRHQQHARDIAIVVAFTITELWKRPFALLIRLSLQFNWGEVGFRVIPYGTYATVWRVLAKVTVA